MRARHAVIAFALALVALPAAAQQFPAKLVRLVNPYPTGGPSDILVRDLAAGLSAQLKQQVIVESKPGGGATIGADFVARSPADGYTLLMAGAPSMVITPAMQAKPIFDGARDFTAIGMVTRVPNVIVVRPGLPIATMAELVDYARANPGKLSYGSPGPGSIPQIGIETLKQASRIDLVHIPYKGGAGVVTDMLGGTLDSGMVNLAAALPHIRSGKLRALGMALPARSELLPELATVAELGFKTYDGGTWYGVFGPAGVPPAVVRTLAAALDRVLAAPDFAARVRDTQGSSPVRMTPEELGAYVRREQAELVPLVKALGLKAD